VEQSQTRDRPLVLTGIDSRHVGDISAGKHIDSLVRAYKLAIPTNDLDFFNETLNNVLQREYKDTINTTDERRFFEILKRVKDELSKTSVDKFWIQELDNLRAYAMHSWHCVIDEEKEYYNNSHRDRQMADNVIWLLNERYKGKKIIVWAANMHVVKNYSTIDTTIYSADEINVRGAEHSLGEYLTNDKQELCTFITIAYGGKGSDFEFNPYPMDTVHRNSVESWFHQVGYPYAFVTLEENKTNATETNAILNSGFYGHAARVNLKSTCDVILFIDEMQPNKKTKASGE
jgi:erythromycin esterase-like protein